MACVMAVMMALARVDYWANCLVGLLANDLALKLVDLLENSMADLMVDLRAVQRVA